MGGSHEHSSADTPGSGKDTSRPLFVAPTAEEMNEMLPQFEFQELIGQGGMGAVYRARQPKLDRFVAIKLLPAISGNDANGFGARFEREARAMAKLSHPNVVTVHDFGESEQGHRYIVMEYIEGSDLHTLIRTAQLSTKHAMAWIPQICSALQYAHDNGIIHRDIKPANILIRQDGTVKVGDFGLAKLIDRRGQRHITRTQVSMGTPDYAAPEALEQGGEVDARADIYSLGVLFYELLTGKVPRGAWQPPSAIKDVDVRLDRIIVKAMQPDPAHRYQSVSQVTTALQEIRRTPKVVVPKKVQSKNLATGRISVSASSRRTTNAPSTSGSGVRKRGGDLNPFIVAGIAGGGVLVVVGLILLMLIGTPERPSQAKVPQLPPEVVEPKEKMAGAGENSATEKPSPPKPSKETVTEEAGDRPKAPFRPPSGLRDRILTPEMGTVDLLEKVELRRYLTDGAWDWNGNGSLELAEKNGRRPVATLHFPVIAGSAYDLNLELEGGAGARTTVHLPLERGQVMLTLGSGLGDKSGPFIALAEVDGLSASAPENPTRRPVDLVSGATHRLAVKVVSGNREVGIRVDLDGVEVLRWMGKPNQLSVSGPRSKLSDRVPALSSQGPMVIHSAEIAALSISNSADLEMVLGPSPPEEPPMTETVGPPVPPKLKPVSLSEVELRLKALKQEFDNRVAVEVTPVYKAAVEDRNEKYRAALNRMLESVSGSADLRQASALRRELERLRLGKPIEPTDPQDMPEIVREARDRYREQMAQLEREQDKLLLPLLHDHVGKLEIARTEYVSISNMSAATAVASVRDQVLSRIAEIEERVADMPEMLGVNDSGGQERESLARPVFPIERPDEKGGVVAWARTPGVELMDMGDVPSGLRSTAVAIAGGADVAVALKSSGRLEMWGIPPEEVPQEVLDLRRIVRVEVAQDDDALHLATIDDDGKVDLYTQGWGASAPTFETQARAIEQAVDIALRPTGGLALVNDGTVTFWGSTVTPAGEDLENIARLNAGPDVATAIKENFDLIYWGRNDSLMPPALEKVRDVAFGTQAELGGVALLMDGRVLTWGAFAPWQSELSRLAETQTIESLKGGYHAFAARTDDGEWHFFGQGIDAAHCAEKARRCSDVVIGRTYIVGLETS